MNNNNDLREFIASFGKSLSLRGICAQLEIPYDGVIKWFKGRETRSGQKFYRASLPDTSRIALESWAKQYGFNPEPCNDQLPALILEQLKEKDRVTKIRVTTVFKFPRQNPPQNEERISIVWVSFFFASSPMVVSRNFDTKYFTLEHVVKSLNEEIEAEIDSFSCK